MSVTNKKVDALRRLLLGNLYQECKDNPNGVSKERLQEHLDKIKEEGCIGECSIEEFVNTCQLKSHYPTCVNTEYRGCVEGIGEKSKGVNKFYYDQYKRSKMVEDEPDTEEEEEEEGEMCNVCGLKGNDDIGIPVEEMSCGHNSHINCLIRVAQQKGRDYAECPECRKTFYLEEVPVPGRTLQERQADSARRALFNTTQMGFNIPTQLRTDEDEESQMERELFNQTNRREQTIPIVRHRTLEQRQNDHLEEIYDLESDNIPEGTRILAGIVESIKDEDADVAIEQISLYTNRFQDSNEGLNYILSRTIETIGINHNYNISILKRIVDALFETNIQLMNRPLEELSRMYNYYQGEQNVINNINYIITKLPINIRRHVRRN